MKQSQMPIFKLPTVFLCLISMVTYGQTQKKTFSESFDVATDAILDINTSHADIEFETWNKDKVVIEATIVLEGASEAEANRYFADGGFEIMGSSSRITVSTGKHSTWAVQALDNIGDFNIELPEISEFESFDFDFEFSDMEDLPPMPPVPNPNFDHEAFEKDGEKYLKEWQKNFQKDFGEPYQKRMKEWQEKMEDKRNEMRERRQVMHEKRTEAQGERMEKLAQKRTEAHQNRMADHQARIAQRNATRATMPNRPNIFYTNSKGENRNYKVKKTIKIKMPKSTKIKMNIRHGEVKLAENTNNLDATLSHASLLAATIDGEKTMVMASYSPVSVEKWIYGRLQADYSENVDLKEVMNLRLSATSSEVSIANLSNTAFIKNSFGPLVINAISKDFETLDVYLQNAELFCHLPESVFELYVKGMESQFTSPPELVLRKIIDHGNVFHEGAMRDRDSGKSIVINSKYSDVFLE